MSRLTALLLAAVTSLVLAFAEDASAHEEFGEGSYYGYELAGNLTASGEPFDPMGLTVAHPYLPLNSYVTVCYTTCVVARVNDRGPAAWTGRIVDFSLGTALATGLYWSGVGPVVVYH